MASMFRDPTSDDLIVQGLEWETKREEERRWLG